MKDELGLKMVKVRWVTVYASLSLIAMLLSGLGGSKDREKESND